MRPTLCLSGLLALAPFANAQSSAITALTPITTSSTTATGFDVDQCPAGPVVPVNCILSTELGGPGLLPEASTFFRVFGRDLGLGVTADADARAAGGPAVALVGTFDLRFDFTFASPMYGELVMSNTGAATGAGQVLLDVDVGDDGTIESSVGSGETRVPIAPGAMSTTVRVTGLVVAPDGERAGLQLSADFVPVLRCNAAVVSARCPGPGVSLGFGPLFDGSIAVSATGIGLGAAPLAVIGFSNVSVPLPIGTCTLTPFPDIVVPMQVVIPNVRYEIALPGIGPATPPFTVQALSADLGLMTAHTSSAVGFSGCR